MKKLIVARRMARTSSARVIALFGLLLAVAPVACSAPTGPAMTANGSHVIVTNPAGGGPQVIRRGPPDYWGGAGSYAG